jgi:hypothetical protein
MSCFASVSLDEDFSIDAGTLEEEEEEEVVVVVGEIDGLSTRSEDLGVLEEEEADGCCCC